MFPCKILPGANGIPWKQEKLQKNYRKIRLWQGKYPGAERAYFRNDRQTLPFHPA